MKKCLVVLSVLSVAFFGSSKAWSQDDVVVDLSVLGEVGSAPGVQSEDFYQPAPAYNMPVYDENVPVIPAAQGAVPAPSTQVQPGSVSTILNLSPLEPQFPVVKPKPKPVKKVRPVNKVKPAVKEQKAQENKIEEAPKTVEEDYNVSIISEPAAEEAAKVLDDANKAQEEADRILSEDVAAETSVNDMSNAASNDNIIEEALDAAEETVDAIETKNVAVEKVIERADEDFRIEEEKLREKLSDETTDETLSTGVPTQLVTPTQLVVPNKEVVESTLDSSDTSAVPAAAAVEENKTEVNSAEAQVEAGNFIEAKELEDESAAKAEVKEEVISNRIVFDGEETTLTEADKEKIVKIVSVFENPGQNKIGIFSYNLDNGEDVFKRKRQSLSRATEVRSFLISKGYKNYSIKVVNVDESSEKGNTVEIAEIK